MMNSDNPAIVSEPRQHLVYGFKVEDKIPCAERLPREFITSAECNIVDVIYESFVVTADQDYLTARLLAQSGLYRAFYWAAAQSIEKYLKAFLLLRGESVKDATHGLQALFARAATLDASLLAFTIEPHALLPVPEHASSYLKIFSTSEFLCDIDNFGHPDNRYNSSGVDFNSGYLFALDHFIFCLRERMVVPDIWQNLRKVEDHIIDMLEKHNPWFSRKPITPVSPEPEILVKISIAVTKLDFLVKQNQNPPYKLALKWLNQMMKLPKKSQKEIDKF